MYSGYKSCAIYVMCRCFLFLYCSLTYLLNYQLFKTPVSGPQPLIKSSWHHDTEAVVRKDCQGEVSRKTQTGSIQREKVQGERSKQKP